MKYNFTRLFAIAATGAVATTILLAAAPASAAPGDNRAVKIGMSAPANEWTTRLREVGGTVEARRIFGQLGSSSAMKLARSEVAAGRSPVLSFKVPNNDWRGVASGRYDTQLQALNKELVSLNSWVFVTLHHEPAKDGTAKDWSDMLIHALPLLKGGDADIKVGPIANGWWWSNQARGYSDTEMAAWLPPALLRVSDIIVADHYQMDANGREDGGTRMENMSAWAGRVGVTQLGVGEYNGVSAAAIKHAGDVATSDPKFAFACVWNSAAKQNFVLTGDRLAAFKTTLTQAR